MQFSVLIATVFATVVAASPLDLPHPPAARTYSDSPTSTLPPYPNPTGHPPVYDACPSGLFSSPQCCATDILGLADLDCHAAAAVPNSVDQFRSICAAGGQRARCCVLPVAGQALLCQSPAGI